MQLYVHDVLDVGRWSFEPNNNFRVDFGFWTGSKLIAVEIDGNEPEGYARDVRRDRLLRRADVDVVHILNTEIDKHGRDLMVPLLPQSIGFEWAEAPSQNAPRANPVSRRQPPQFRASEVGVNTITSPILARSRRLVVFQGWQRRGSTPLRFAHATFQTWPE